LALSVLLLGGNFAHAGTPSYIGPWSYTVDLYKPTRVFSSQEEAVAAVLAYRIQEYNDSTIKSPQCNFRISPDPFVNSVSQRVEGVDAYVVVYLGVRFDKICDGRPIPQPPGFFEQGDIFSAFGKVRVVCASTQHYFDGLCLEVTPVDIADKGKNFGPPCDCAGALSNPNVGEPINTSTGNMWHVEQDYRALTGDDPLAITRTYNSSRLRPGSSDAAAFGKRWSNQYDAAVTPTVASTGTAVGRCWRLVTEPARIICDNPQVPPGTVNAVNVSRGDGKSYIFQRQPDNSWLGDADTNSRLASTLTSDGAIAGWTFLSAEGGSTERFDVEGKLLSIMTRSLQTQRLTYSTGETNDTSVGRAPVDAPVCGQVHPGAPVAKNRLLCVTDQWGRQLQFQYDVAGRIVQVINPENQTTQYEYDGVSGGCTPDLPDAPACKVGNLTKVSYPDGASRTYAYNERTRINAGNSCATTPPPIGAALGPLPNALTGLFDENGARYVSWTYNCGELATSSELAGGVEKVTLSYDYDSSSKQFITTIYDFVGDPAAPHSANVAFFAKPFLGVYKNTSLTGPCAECGGIQSRTYDANGNLTTSQDFAGIQTNYRYDIGRNLQISRTEAVGTTEVRTISTEWHPLFRLPVRVAEPKRLTTYSYDSAGNLLSRMEEATGDLTGAAAFAASKIGKSRIWRYTYNQLGQVMSVTGPRTDQFVQTSYTYDAMGNLDSVTDPLGRKTLLSNYTASGLVGRIAAPNGTVTELTYTPRGWLATKSVTSGAMVETTVFSYDAAGQLRKLTLPDQSSIDYAYDDAHRLVRVSDSLGNSVNYALDLRGNRMREQTVDPDGVLQRQISRQFNDYNNQLYKVTGGEL
jgi:YD repeat-containing protein